MKHARLSASGAHRWLACPGSIAAEDAFGDQRSSYAAEGSAAHALCERCLVHEQDADQYLGWHVTVGTQDLITEHAPDPIGENETTFAVDKEMVDAVQQYLDYVRSIPGELIIEQRVNFSRWVPEGFGTADAVVVAEGICHIIDFKYGKGVRIDADENPQMMLYGLGALHEFEFIYDYFEKFQLTVVQPRLDHISEYEISYDDLLMWGDLEVKPAADLACSDHAPRKPGEKQCRFCKAKGTCKALAESSLALIFEGFEDQDPSITEPTPKCVDSLSPEEVAEILKHTSLIKDWVGALEAHAHAQLTNGAEIPGWKLVAGRSSRDWNDAAKAEGALKRKLGAKNAYQPRKLLSPAQAEKVLGKDDLIMKRYVEKKEGKPALAPVSDKRPAVNLLAGFEPQTKE